MTTIGTPSHAALLAAAHRLLDAESDAKAGSPDWLLARDLWIENFRLLQDDAADPPLPDICEQQNFPPKDLPVFLPPTSRVGMAQALVAAQWHYEHAKRAHAPADEKVIALKRDTDLLEATLTANVNAQSHGSDAARTRAIKQTLAESEGLRQRDALLFQLRAESSRLALDVSITRHRLLTLRSIAALYAAGDTDEASDTPHGGETSGT